MRFISTFICVAILVTSKASKDANDSNLTVALVKALQSQLKTCMDQNRDLVQRSCQKSVRWGEHKGKGNCKVDIVFQAGCLSDLVYWKFMVMKGQQIWICFVFQGLLRDLQNFENFSQILWSCTTHFHNPMPVISLIEYPNFHGQVSTFLYHFSENITHYYHLSRYNV